MALEGTYEYECMRAELLEIEKPDYEEFMKNKAEKEEAERAALEAETHKESEFQKESFVHTSGKLDELGNILKSTQKKINILTAPFSTYLKSKIGLGGNAGTSKTNDDDSHVDPTERQLDSDEQRKDPDGEVQDYTTEIKYPLKLEDNLDKTSNNMPLIDGLIEKTDKNMLSMEYQIKQMKRFK